MATDSSSLKKIKTAQIAHTCQGICKLIQQRNHTFKQNRSSQIITLTITINKQIPENNRSKIYLW